MSIDIRQYVIAHNKAPRGYGNWAFSDRHGQTIQFFCGTYTEAKKAAIQWAKQNNIPTLYLLG